MKTYLIDTNTIIDEPESILEFGNNKVVIPFTLINEIDGLKKASGYTGQQAKKFNRILAQLCISSSSQKIDLQKGIDLKNGGILVAEKSHEELLPKDYPKSKPDNKILSIALYFIKKKEDVIFITSDNNLIIKASSLGIKSFPYDNYKKNNSSNNVYKKSEELKNIDNSKYENNNKELELEKSLIENGIADVNDKNEYGEKKIVKACENENLELIKYLVDHGADVNAKNTLRESVLVEACERDNTAIVKCLVEHGADVNAKNSLRESVLVIACEKENTAIVKCLVEHGADVNAKNSLGEKVLEIAYERKNMEIVKCLVNEIKKREFEAEKKRELETEKRREQFCFETKQVLKGIWNTIKEISKKEI